MTSLTLTMHSGREVESDDDSEDITSFVRSSGQIFVHLGVIIQLIILVINISFNYVDKKQSCIICENDRRHPTHGQRANKRAPRFFLKIFCRQKVSTADLGDALGGGGVQRSPRQPF